MQWMIATFLGALLSGRSQAKCELSESELFPILNRGNIHPDNFPTTFDPDQHCTWKLPNQKFRERGLFVYFEQLDLVDNQSRLGILHIGNFRDSQMPTANCRFYGKNISDVNTTKLSSFFNDFSRSKARSCTGWYFDQNMPEDIVFRAYNTFTKEDSKDKTFYLKYEYIDVSVSTTLPDWTNSTTEERMATGQTEGNQADNNTIPIALVVGIACVLLISSNILIWLCLWRKRRTKDKRITQSLPIQESKFNNAAYASIRDPTLYASVPSGEHSNAAISDPAHPYSSVSAHGLSDQAISDSAAPYALAASDGPPTSQVMYDVPRNNRLRTPTVSEEQYQVPSFLAAVRESPEEKSTHITQGKDVYAVVDKDRKEKVSI